MYSDQPPHFDEGFTMNLVQRTRQRFAQLRDTFQAANNTEALTALILAERAFEDSVHECTPNPGDKLTLADAARWSGYSRGYLTAMVRDGQLKNYGRKRNPRFIRAELPRKGREAANG